MRRLATPLNQDDVKVSRKKKESEKENGREVGVSTGAVAYKKPEFFHSDLFNPRLPPNFEHSLLIKSLQGIFEREVKSPSLFNVVVKNSNTKKSHNHLARSGSFLCDR